MKKNSIKCPHCGREYLPGEIFMPKSFLGQPKNVIKHPTEGSVLAYDGDNTVLRIRLETGRHHQIRVQMANFHHPLVGDSLYGSKVTKNIKLHAYKLAFLDPVTKELKEYINYPTWYERK